MRFVGGSPTVVLSDSDDFSTIRRRLANRRRALLSLTTSRRGGDLGVFWTLERHHANDASGARRNPPYALWKRAINREIHRACIAT